MPRKDSERQYTRSRPSSDSRRQPERGRSSGDTTRQHERDRLSGSGEGNHRRGRPSDYSEGQHEREYYSSNRERQHERKYHSGDGERQHQSNRSSSDREREYRRSRRSDDREKEYRRSRLSDDLERRHKGDLAFGDGERRHELGRRSTDFDKRHERGRSPGDREGRNGRGRASDDGAERRRTRRSDAGAAPSSRESKRDLRDPVYQQMPSDDGRYPNSGHVGYDFSPMMNSRSSTVPSATTQASHFSRDSIREGRPYASPEDYDERHRVKYRSKTGIRETPSEASRSKPKQSNKMDFGIGALLGGGNLSREPKEKRRVYTRPYEWDEVSRRDNASHSKEQRNTRNPTRSAYRDINDELVWESKDRPYVAYDNVSRPGREDPRRASTFGPEKPSKAPNYTTEMRVPRYLSTTERNSKPAEPFDNFEATTSAPRSTASQQPRSGPTYGEPAGRYDSKFCETRDPGTQPSSNYMTAEEFRNMKPKTLDEEFEEMHPLEREALLRKENKEIRQEWMTYRARLGLSLDEKVKLTPEMITKAYRQKAILCHPDKSGTDKEAAQERTAELNEAKAQLVQLCHNEDVLEKGQYGRR